MPWKVNRPMDERLKFIGRLLGGDRMSDLCQEFGISRKTGYKFWKRYQEGGAQGLADASRRPHRLAKETHQQIQQVVIQIRQSKPTWGPKKIRSRLEDLFPGTQLPAASTIGLILERAGAEPAGKSRRKRREGSTVAQHGQTGLLTDGDSPNEVWCIDFKGQFRLGSGDYCYPLTVSDHFSRFLLGCESLEDTKGTGVIEGMRAIFREHGLPRVIRSDNGSPFASARGLLGLSELSAWWIKLGIEPQRIQPGHPEQNGRHERFHLTLKQATARPAAANFLQQQEKFDLFREEYNSERPHEALGMKKPAQLYETSSRKYPDQDDVELEYPMHDIARIVSKVGQIKLPSGVRVFVTSALRGETLGLRENAPGLWLLTFGHLDLGLIDEKKEKLLPMHSEEALILEETG